jgi:hypothetical protein
VLSDAFPLSEHQKSLSCKARINQQAIEREGWHPTDPYWASIMVEYKEFPYKKLTIPRSGLIASWDKIVNQRPRSNKFVTCFFVPAWLHELIIVIDNASERYNGYFGFKLIKDQETKKLPLHFCEKILLLACKNEHAREHMLAAIRLADLQAMLSLPYFKINNLYKYDME